MTHLARLIVVALSSVVLVAAGARHHYAADLPFSVGERAQYKASYLIGRVGTGVLEIPEVDTARGRRVLHLRMTIRGGIPGARIDERLESWLDEESIYSHRYRLVGGAKNRLRRSHPVEFCTLHL